MRRKRGDDYEQWRRENDIDRMKRRRKESDDHEQWRRENRGQDWVSDSERRQEERREVNEMRG